MNKPVYLLPFIWIYRLVSTIFKIMIKIMKYFLSGIFFLGYYAILGVMNGFIFIFKYSLLGFVTVSYLIYFILGKGIARVSSLTFRGIYTWGYLIVKGFSATGIFFLNIIDSLSEKKPNVKPIPAPRPKEPIKVKKEIVGLKKNISKEVLKAEIKPPEKVKKKKQEKDEYLNEKVKIERKKLSDIINDFFKSLSMIPENTKKWYHNLSMVRNKRNQHAIERQALLINFDGDDAKKSDHKILYEYVAKNADGKVLKGYFEAYSKVEVHSFLLSEGYEVYSIRSSKWITFLHGRASVNRVKFKHKDLIFFLTQLSTYIKAGIPLVDSLKILNRQYKNKNYHKILRSIIYDLTMGDNFSEALSKQGAAFPRLLINMTKAAEMTGELPEALDEMAEYYTETEKTRKQMITALMYPSIIFVISVAVISFIMIYVIPKFVEIYESMDASKIPAFTKAVMATSDFLQNYFLYILLVIGVLVAIFIYLNKNVKVFRTFVQWGMMHMPVFGNVIIYNEVTMFTKTLASLLSHNVFITNSMEVLNKITNNEIYKMIILDTIANIAKGEKISLAFKDHWAFPVPAYEMLVTGEMTGQVPDMMAKVASYYQELHKNAVTRIKTFVEPVLIIGLTVVVGIIILAIIIPMFNLYNQVNVPE